MGRKFLVLVVLLAALASARSADKLAEKPKPPADKDLEAEVARLRKQLALEQKRIVVLLKEQKELRDRLVAAEIAARTHRDKEHNLERQLQRLARQVARLRVRSAAAPVVVNPPKEKVEGLIERVGDKGLVTVNVGSDAGLAVGHTLEVFRLGAAPRYLGRIRILEVKPKEAVGQVVGRPTATLEKGDRVASRIATK
jgi:hypothetical protein